jgi:sigma-B regulation protein RsbU (phosphoserine phosphatase)
LLTDGIVEQKNAAREEFGIDRLQKVLTEMRLQKPAVVLGEVWRRACEFAGTDRFSDDVTLLIADLS